MKLWSCLKENKIIQENDKYVVQYKVNIKNKTSVLFLFNKPNQHFHHNKHLNID